MCKIELITALALALGVPQGPCPEVEISTSTFFDGRAIHLQASRLPYCYKSDLAHEATHFLLALHMRPYDAQVAECLAIRMEWRFEKVRTSCNTKNLECATEGASK